jgi:hypothetical protein
MNILALLLALSDSIATLDGVVIASDSACPSAVAVQDALRDLPHASLLATAAAVKTEEMLTVELTTAHREGRALRRLPLDADCARRAESVALVIVSWADAGAAQPPLLVVSDLISPFEAKPKAEPARSVWEAGAGFLSVSDSFGSSAGLRLEVARVPPQSGLGWRVAATLAGSRMVPDWPGVSRYTRSALAFTALASLTEGHLHAEADVGPVLGLTHAYGDGFTRDRSQSALVPGATLGGRFGLRGGWMTLWVEARGLLWLTGQSVVSERLVGDEILWGGGRRTLLPNLEVHVAVGTSAMLPARWP